MESELDGRKVEASGEHFEFKSCDSESENARSGRQFAKFKKLVVPCWKFVSGSVFVVAFLRFRLVQASQVACQSQMTRCQARTTTDSLGRL